MFVDHAVSEEPVYFLLIKWAMLVEKLEKKRAHGFDEKTVNATD